MLSSSVFALVAVASALANPVRRDLQVHESRADIPAGFTLTGPAPSDQVLTLRLALVQNDPAGLVDALYDVSTPSSANYGKHLSKEEVNNVLVNPMRRRWLTWPRFSTGRGIHRSYLGQHISC